MKAAYEFKVELSSGASAEEIGMLIERILVEAKYFQVSNGEVKTVDFHNVELLSAEVVEEDEE